MLYALLALFALVALGATPAFAVVTLPDVGFDLSDYITAVWTQFATYFSDNLGFAMLFIAIVAGIAFVRRMVKGSH